MKTFLIACEYMRKYYNFKTTRFRREVIKVLLRPEYKGGIQ